MAVNKCRRIPIGSIGPRIEFLVRECLVDGTVGLVDLSPGGENATNLEVWLRSPSGNVKTFAGTFTSSGADSLFGYALQGGDLDEEGTWEAQGCFYLNGVGPLLTSVERFEAFYGLKIPGIVNPGTVGLHLFVLGSAT